MEGTHSGPVAGPDGADIPATGRSVSLPYAGIHTLAGGQIVHSRLYWDELGMLGQLA